VSSFPEVVRRVLLPAARLAALLALALPGQSATIKLPGSTVVRLELQQNITSAYTEPESPVYFRVVDDVLAEGAVAIRKGTLVVGRITSADARRMMGVSGRLGLDVRFVPAVDGQQIRVLGSAVRAGRSRDDAVVGWSLFWGIGGLMTHGVNAHLERGAIIEAQVLSDRRIDASVPVALPPAPTAAALSAVVLGHKMPGSSSKQLRLNLEKNPLTGAVTFRFQWPDDLAADPLATMELLGVNGVDIPVPVPGLVLKADEVAFGPWKLAQYCVDGVNSLHFHGISHSGVVVDYNDSLEVIFLK
jgi:hypothetical protein